MAKTLSEKQVLKKLGIKDFRHLSKDSVMSFASMLPDMDPEVAMKALEQFPDFAKTILDTMKEYKGSIDKAMEKGSESVKQSYAAYKAVMDALEKSLEDGELSFDERMEILKRMDAVADKVSLKDKEHKKFIVQNLAMLGTFALVGVGVLAAALGGNTKIGDLTESVIDKLQK